MSTPGLPAAAPAALDAEFGWSDDEPTAQRRAVNSAVLLVAAGACWGATWLTSGFAPVTYLIASRGPMRERDLK